MYEIFTKKISEYKKTIHQENKSNTKYLNKYKITHLKKIINLEHVYVIIPTLPRNKFYSLYLHTESSLGTKDDTTLRFVPYLITKTKSIYIKNYENTILIDPSLSFKEEIIKNILLDISNKFTYKEIITMKKEKNYDNIFDKLSEVLEISNNELLYRYFRYKKYMDSHDYWFCNVCFIFCCFKHDNVTIFTRKF
ncbi:hypothetical protein COBT_001070 [Conglomerata obtusa]